MKKGPLPFRFFRLGPGKTALGLLAAAGVGTRFVCAEAKRMEIPHACWQPEGVPAFADSAAKFCSFEKCEWSPATRTLTRLSAGFRFVFTHFDGRGHDTLDVDRILDRIDPVVQQVPRSPRGRAP